MLIKLRFTHSLCKKYYLPFVYKIKENCTTSSTPTGSLTELEKVFTFVPFYDFNNKLNNFNELQQNIEYRQIKNINLKELYKLWNKYTVFQNERNELELARRRIADEIKKYGVDNGTEILQLKQNGIKLKDQLKQLKELNYSDELIFINQFLKLPNDIDHRTPVNDTEKVLTTHLNCCSGAEMESKTSETNMNFIECGAIKSTYYLTDKAAKFDLLLPIYFHNYFINLPTKRKPFIMVSNPDFIKSRIITNCGLSLDDYYSIVEGRDVINKSSNYLIGNGSTLSFLGFIARLSIYPKNLPMKLVYSGKEYKDVKNVISQSIRETIQCTTCQLFIADTKDNIEMEMTETITNCIELYKKFDEHFRVVYAPATKLSSIESLRVDFQMYSKSLKQYQQIGYLSYYNDYISKRLLFNYKHNRELRFPHIVAGNVLNVQKILAIMLENRRTIDLPKFLNDMIC